MTNHNVDLFSKWNLKNIYVDDAINDHFASYAIMFSHFNFVVRGSRLFIECCSIYILQKLIIYYSNYSFSCLILHTDQWDKSGISLSVCMFIIFNCLSALKLCNEQQRNHKNPKENTWIMNLRINISRISLFQRVRECAVLIACLKMMLNKQKIKKIEKNCDWTNQRIRNFKFIPFIKILRIVSHFW